METIKTSKIIDRAKDEITGFTSIYAKLEQKVILGGLSSSTLLNYGRCIAKISLHFKCPPMHLDEEQINGYLQHLLSGDRPSKSYFKHTVYGLRFLFRAQDNKVIDTDYYHVVFTLPSCLHDLCRTYPRQMYAMLMRTAWKTIDGFGCDHKYLGSQTGAIMVLHTWGSTMTYHPHVHCIVPGGGIGYTGIWKQARYKGEYFFPVKAMSNVFRGNMATQIKKLLNFKELATC